MSAVDVFGTINGGIGDCIVIRAAGGIITWRVDYVVNLREPRSVPVYGDLEGPLYGIEVLWNGLDVNITAQRIPLLGVPVIGEVIGAGTAFRISVDKNGRPTIVLIDGVVVVAQNTILQTFLGAPTQYIDDSVIYVYVQGYAIPFDGGGARFKISATPTTPPTLNDAYFVSLNGRVFIHDDPVVNIKSLGAKGGFLQVAAGGSISVGSTTLTVVGASFTSAADVGKWIQVDGAGTLINDATTGNWTDYLTTTIASVTSATIVELAAPAVQTVSAAKVHWGYDDSAAIVSACRAAATMLKPAYVPSGDYLAIRSLCAVNGYSNFHLYGDGIASRIVHGTMGVATALPNPSGVLFQFVGAIVARTTLSGPVAAGVDILPLISTTSIVKDDWLLLRDRSQPLYDTDFQGTAGALSAYVGEWVQVKEVIDATHVQTYGVLQYPYVGSQVAGPPDLRTDVREMSTPVRNVKIHDLLLDCTKPITWTGSACISLSSALSTDIWNVTFRNSNSNSIVTQRALNLNVSKCRFENLGGPDGDATDGTEDLFKGYACNLSTSTWNARIADCTARDLRHFSTSGGGGDVAPQHIHWSACNVTEARIAFDTHPGSASHSFVDCHATSPIMSEEVEIPGFGFQIRGWNTTVEACSVSGGGIGFVAINVPGTRFVNCETRNSLIGGMAWNAPDTEFRGMKIYNPQSAGIMARRTNDGSNPLLSLGDLVLDDIRIYGNPTVAQTASGGYKTYIKCLVPCGFQFGYYTDLDVFVNEWEDKFTLTNWNADDCDVPFVGVDHGAAYGWGLPTAANVIAESVPRNLVESGALAALTTATLCMVRVVLRKGVRIKALGAMFAAAGTTQDNLWFALYDRNRVKLGVTADGTTTEPTPDVITSFDLTSVWTTTYAGDYYVAMMVKGAAVPTVRGVTSLAAITGLAPITVGNSTAGQTVPGSAPATAAAITATAIIPYVVLLGE